tara:strand:+ start:214 stop:957 length:744 start_codon:yes stop_codon:yes gene_type:complete
MNIKKTFKYSPNFDLKKRSQKKIKFIVFHYTGMKSDTEAIRRLTSPKSKVSSHYFIKRNGNIIVLVPDLYTTWHAGKSYWKHYNYLNNTSIGIEISNPGHQFNYINFSKKQAKSIVKLSKYLMAKYKIKAENVLGHSDIAPTRKKDPGEKFPWQFFAKKKINIWHSLNEDDLKKSRLKVIETKIENKFFKNLSKIGYNFKKPSNLKKKYFLIRLVKAFQRRYRQQLINGKIDEECFLISENILKKLN